MKGAVGENASARPLGKAPNLIVRPDSISAGFYDSHAIYAASPLYKIPGRFELERDDSGSFVPSCFFSATRRPHCPKRVEILSWRYDVDLLALRTRMDIRH